MTIQLRSIGLSLAVLAFAISWSSPLRAQQSRAIGSGLESELGDDEFIEETVVVRRRAAPRQASRRAPARSGFPTIFRNTSHRASHARRGFVPPHARQAAPRVARNVIRRRSVLVDDQPGEVIPPGAVESGEVIREGDVYQSVEGDIQLGLDDGHYIEGYPGYPGGHGGYGDCADCGPSGCLIGCPLLNFDNLSVFGGVQGFTGQLNRGGPGSFGFHEGFNWGLPVPCLPFGLGMQVGYQATQSNLSGGGSVSDDRREQSFITAGVFRRVDWGLQAGFAYDWMEDDWYSSSLGQLRGELSWMFPCNHEIGFWFTRRASDDNDVIPPSTGTAPLPSEHLEVIDVYAFFYRWRHDCLPNANGRLSAGFTGDEDGFLAADVTFPINASLSARAGFAYLLPSVDRADQEAWNIGLSLVWQPGCGDECSDYYRPLFDVANNGSFFVRRRQENN